MTEPQIPQDLENQLAGPGGHFPGTAETLATPVGSDKPVRVKIGQADNRHLQLSREEFRARSARQKDLDAQVDPNADPTQEPQVHDTDPPTLPTPAPTQRKHGPPRSVKNKPKPAVPKDQLIGQPCPAPSTTEAPVPPIPIPTDAMLEQRMSRLERGMDMIVRHIAERDERQTQAPETTPDIDVDQTLVGELDDEGNVYDPDDQQPDEAPTPDDPDYVSAPGEPSAATPVEDNPELDAGLQALQQMILKRNPQKVFRQYWCQLSRAAQYNEWPPERREAFDHQFNTIVAHPKFVHQMSTFLRGSRSGNCIGNEQIARVCGMVAGFLTVYQLAAAGK